MLAELSVCLIMTVNSGFQQQERYAINRPETLTAIEEQLKMTLAVPRPVQTDEDSIMTGPPPVNPISPRCWECLLGWKCIVKDRDGTTHEWCCPISGRVGTCAVCNFCITVTPTRDN